MRADVVSEADIIVALEAWCEQAGSHDLVDLLHSTRQLWSWRHHPPASEFAHFVGLASKFVQLSPALKLHHTTTRAALLSMHGKHKSLGDFPLDNANKCSGLLRCCLSRFRVFAQSDVFDVFMVAVRWIESLTCSLD